MILDETIEVGLSGGNAKRFEEMGYKKSHMFKYMGLTKKEGEELWQSEQEQKSI